MREFSRKCPVRFYAVLTALMLFPSTGQAGPTVHNAAEPDFQDPLSNARPSAPAVAATIASVGNVISDSRGFPLELDTGPLDGRIDTGLVQVQTDDITRRVREEFLGGSPANAETRLDAEANPPDRSAASVLQVLGNTVPGGAVEPGTASATATANTVSTASSIIDATLNNMIIAILNPEMTTEGMVTFSIAGFGEFALLPLQESGGMFLVDMQSGKAVRFAEGGDNRLGGPMSANGAGTANQDRATSNALQRVLGILERNVLPIISSPITLATIVLFGIIWIVWRLSGRE